MSNITNIDAKLENTTELIINAIGDLTKKIDEVYDRVEARFNARQANVLDLDDINTTVRHLKNQIINKSIEIFTQKAVHRAKLSSISSLCITRAFKDDGCYIDADHCIIPDSTTRCTSKYLVEYFKLFRDSKLTLKESFDTMLVPCAIDIQKQLQLEQIILRISDSSNLLEKCVANLEVAIQNAQLI